MNRMTDPPRNVTGGIDTHGEVHVAAVVCSTSHQLLSTGSFAATPAGYARLLTWMQGCGRIDRVGVEGTGTYGAGLARFLTAEGMEVLEVDRPDRSARRQHGKSDVIDAEAAARAVLSGRASGQPKSRDGIVEAIRVLRIVYRSAVKDRTAAMNQFHGLTTTAPDQIRQELQQLPRRQRFERARRWRSRAGDNIVTAATRQALRELASRIELLSRQAERAELELDELTHQAAPALRDLTGAGIHTAAQLLVTAGDNPERLRSEVAFAHLCGVAPIPASSGKTHRHRLNQHGDRAANHALWRIVMARMTHDQRTHDYIARRRAEGLSGRDIMRCLSATSPEKSTACSPAHPRPHPAGPNSPTFDDNSEPLSNTSRTVSESTTSRSHRSKTDTGTDPHPTPHPQRATRHGSLTRIGASPGVPITEAVVDGPSAGGRRRTRAVA